ncbi:MAG TPA: cytochrome C [Bacteroidetes bacterium]|nr:cytochrome C [Bacteroidota bacterium]
MGTWTNRWFRAGLVLLLLGFLVSLSLAGQKRRDIIKFSHRFHLKEAGAECANCHPNALKSTKANDNLLPTMEQCGACHDVQDEKNCTQCHYSSEKLEPFESPARAFRFNHSTHLSTARLTCQNCHKGMDKIDYADGTRIPPRESCNVCHNGTVVSQECQLCHTTSVQVLPMNHTADWKHEHMVQVRSGNERDCAHCHTNDECQDCHENVNLMTSKLLPYQYFSAYRLSSRGARPLVVSKVHDLNYRYWHAIDAEGKKEQCNICHEASTSCVQCHTEASVAGAFLHRPAWHGGPDWGAIRGGVGTGGGRHAELAERDIERCAACHDVQGADPTCLMCHTDFDGVKGTDPKTHGSGFADRFGEGAVFHHDDGAVCFNCHVNTHQAGEGFCGYCHGKK